MVARLIEGFESSTNPNDYAGKWTTSPTSGTISPANGRNGNGYRASTTGTWQRTFDSQPTWIVGFALKPTVSTTTSGIVTFLDGAIIHCGVSLTDTANTVFAWRAAAGTVLGTSAVALTPGVWAYLEVKVTIGDAPTGSVVVRLNGAVILNLTSQDTRNAGTASANLVRVTTSTAVVEYLDDLYIFDGTGSVNNDFAGDCKVQQVLPTGAGATTAWTPSAGSNFQCVDDAPPNADTDYVSSATAGQTDTYAFGDLAVASGTVKAVQATAVARKDDAGSRALALVARPGSTDRVGATQGVGDNYIGYTEMWSVNPDTAAAWTVAEVNASQFGLRLVS